MANKKSIKKGAPARLKERRINDERNNTLTEEQESGLVKSNNGRRLKVKEPPYLYRESQEVIRDIESLLGGPVISVWGEIYGDLIPLLYEVLEKHEKQEQLFLLLESSGGNGTAALRMVTLLRQYGQRLVILAPRRCASAATMISIGGEEIQMGPLSYLTAVDTSLTHPLSPIDNRNEKVSVELDEVHRVVSLWQKASGDSGDNPYKYLYNYIHPLVIGSVDRMSSLSIRICKEILSYHMNDEGRIDEISRKLNSDYPAHSYPITFREAQRLGLNVRMMDTNVYGRINELLKIYYEMGQKAITDFDVDNYHNNQISQVIEGSEIQFIYQYDKDWHYRRDEKRWAAHNDRSLWFKFCESDGRLVKEPVYL